MVNDISKNGHFLNKKAHKDKQYLCGLLVCIISKKLRFADFSILYLIVPCLDRMINRV